jgi:hypothetical protein
MFDTGEEWIVPQRSSARDDGYALIPPGGRIIRPGMQATDAGRVRRLGRAISPPTAASCQDDLEHSGRFARDQLPAFSQQEILWRTGNTEALSPARESSEVLAPKTEAAVAYSQGFE